MPIRRIDSEGTCLPGLEAINRSVVDIQAIDSHESHSGNISQGGLDLGFRILGHHEHLLTRKSKLAEHLHHGAGLVFIRLEGVDDDADTAIDCADSDCSTFCGGGGGGGTTESGNSCSPSSCPNCEDNQDNDGEGDACDKDALDCNANGILDECDIADGSSNDVDGNGIPDECELDCNDNGIPDYWDIKTGTSEDCNTNNVPDECDIEDGLSLDFDDDGIGFPLVEETDRLRRPSLRRASG